MKFPKEIDSELERIRSANTSGAEALTMMSAEVFSLLVGQSFPSRAEELSDLISGVAKALVDAQPSMAGIFNLANKTLWATEGKTTIGELKSALDATVQELVLSSAKHLQSITVIASQLIRSGITVVTHSFSSTVYASLVTARKSGTEFAVVCTESRPMCEGVELARQLGQAGIPVTLVADAAVFALIPKASAVFFGADAITAEGLVNKIGSEAIAVVAQRNAVPCYALCTTQKIVPADSRLSRNKPRPATEILSESRQGVTPLNLYFSVTPLELLTGIVTERGMLTPTKITIIAAAMKTHPVLQRESDPPPFRS